MKSTPSVLNEAEIRAIAAGILAGDDRKFGVLMRTYQPYAFSLAFRLLHNEQDARDAVQDAFVSVWRHIADYDPSRKFTTWLYAIVSNRCMDMLRSRKRRTGLFASDEPTLENIPDALDLSSIHSNRELAGIIASLTRDLPPTQRLVFVLRDVQDLSIEEVAETTGLSVSSVKANLSYARRRIREIFKQRHQTEGLEP